MKLATKSQTAKPFFWPTRVYYEDTDAGGVVYYANYLRFMERARTEWLRSLGVEQDQTRAELGLIFVVVSVEIEYDSPARFNDALEVSVTVAEMRSASLTFAQQITRDGKVLCHATVRVASVNADNLKPRRLPPVIREVVG